MYSIFSKASRLLSLSERVTSIVKFTCCCQYCECRAWENSVQARQKTRIFLTGGISSKIIKIVAFLKVSAFDWEGLVSSWTIASPEFLNLQGTSPQKNHDHYFPFPMKMIRRVCNMILKSRASETFSMYNKSNLLRSIISSTFSAYPN